ncbi:hypothetical protein ACFX11_028337 [Malus domestica]
MPTEDVSAKKEKEKSQVVRVCAGQFCIDFVGAFSFAECLVFIVAGHRARVPILFELGFLLRINITSVSPISARTTNLVLN